jgi:hypothetical protein
MEDREAHHCATAVGIFQVRKFCLILQTFSQVEDKATLTSVQCVFLIFNFFLKYNFKEYICKLIFLIQIFITKIS